MLTETPIAFESADATLHGCLVRAAGASTRRPAVIMAQGTSATIRMVAIVYARAFAQAGLAASIYDHRSISRGIIMKRLPELLAVFAFALGVASGPTYGADAAVPKHPDVVSAKVRPSGADTFDFDVTVSSPYDTPQRYADAFRVSGKDGTVYGERELLHDHANEQPFTRDLHGVRIPRAVRVVVVQARDRKFGYGGRSIEVVLPGR